MCADSIVRRKPGNRARENAEVKVERLLVRLPKDLINKARAHGAMHGEIGPASTIERALTEYLKRNPISAIGL